MKLSKRPSHIVGAAVFFLITGTMEEQPKKSPQFGLKHLLLVPVAAGVIAWLYTAGLAAELLFMLLAVPLILILWLVMCRVASHFLSDLLD